MKILSVDVGTTAMKMAVFEDRDHGLESLRQFSHEYTINTYNDGLFSDIEPEKWQLAFAAGCKELSGYMRELDVIAFSGTTPGLTAMDREGKALYPAILMLDQRSRPQAQRIIDTIGMDKLLNVTANMPVAGGSSLAGILWLKDNLPEIFNQIYVFGHSNTFMARWLSDKFALDPSSASLTAMYNTVSNDLSWNTEILKEFELEISRCRN
jgi:xylulokinase